MECREGSCVENLKFPSPPPSLQLDEDKAKEWVLAARFSNKRIPHQIRGSLSLVFLLHQTIINTKGAASKINSNVKYCYSCITPDWLLNSIYCSRQTESEEMDNRFASFHQQFMSQVILSLPHSFILLFLKRNGIFQFDFNNKILMHHLFV